MARPSMAEISGTALVGGTELAQALAQALGEGAAESQNMDVGSIAVQDTSGTASRMEDEGLISQGTPGGFQSSTYSDSAKREPGESFMDYTTRMNREMYPGHYEAAQAYGATGMNAFGQKHKDFIENNKSQMKAMGIQPSHKNNAGQLTGRYSSNDWKAFQSALAGGTMATEDLDDETIAMEESPGLYPNQIGITPPAEELYPNQIGITPPAEGLYPNQIGITPPVEGLYPNQIGITPPSQVDDFSTWGQQVQPGAPVQVDMGPGYAPAPMTGPEQFTNFTAATTPMSGVQMTAPGESTSPYISDYGGPDPEDQASQYGAISQLGAMGHQFAPGNPQGYMPNYTTQQLVEDQLAGGGAAAVDSFTNMPATSPGITSPITGPEQFGGYQQAVAQGYPFAGPQMTAPGQSTTAGVDSFAGMPGYGEMDEGTLDPNAGLISRGTQAWQAGMDQAQSLYPNQIGVGQQAFDAGVDQAQALSKPIMRGLTPTVIESVTESIQTIADKPIADGTDAPELIKNNVSSGGSHESRVEDLVKAGVPQTLTNLMEDSAVAMLHFALTQLVAQYPNEKITFNDLIPYIQKMNLAEGGELSVWGGGNPDPSQFLDKRNPPFTGEIKNPNDFLDKRNPPITGKQKDFKDYLEPM